MPRVVLHIRPKGSSIMDEEDATVVTDYDTSIDKLKEKVIFALHLAPEGAIGLSSDPDLKAEFVGESDTRNDDTLYYRYKAMKRTPSFKSPSKTILKKEGENSEAMPKSDSQEKEFRWDEDNIELYDIEKKLNPRTKIDEPDTPYHTTVVDQLSGAVKDNFQLTRESYQDASGGTNLPQPNIDILNEIRRESRLADKEEALINEGNPASDNADGDGVDTGAVSNGKIDELAPASPMVEEMLINEGDLIIPDDSPYTSPEQSIDGGGRDSSVDRQRCACLRGDLANQRASRENPTNQMYKVNADDIVGALTSSRAIEERSKLASSSDSDDEAVLHRKIHDSQFKSKRKAHYNEAEVLKNWRTKHTHGEEEEEEEEEEPICSFGSGSGAGKKRNLADINKQWDTDK